MAVENKYVNADIVAGRRTESVFTGIGAKVVALIAEVAISAADDDGSIYRLFKDIPSTYVPFAIDLESTAITGGTDYDLGLYKTNLGAVVDKDCLMDGQTFATALTPATGSGLGLGARGIANSLKNLGDLSGQTKPDGAYDLCLTANTVGTAAGTVVVRAIFVAQ